VIDPSAILDVLLAYIGNGPTLLLMALGALLTFLGARHP
jgi:hypothetical protein